MPVINSGSDPTKVDKSSVIAAINASSESYKISVSKVGPVKINFSSAYTGFGPDPDGVPSRSTASNLSHGRQYGSSASVANYVIFAGGSSFDSGSYEYTNTVEAYNVSLTRTNVSSLIDKVINQLSAGSITNICALFGGGSTSFSYSTYITSYNTSLTRSFNDTFDSVPLNAAATTGINSNGYVIFAGGEYSNTIYDRAIAYNSSLTKTNVAALSKGRCLLTGASIGGYALFAGGLDGSGNNDYSNIVDAYDASLTKSTSVSTLSKKKIHMSGGTVKTSGSDYTGSYALFAGGYAYENYDDVISNTVEAYNISLTKTSATNLSLGKYDMATGNVGKYILFAGGSNYVSKASVDKYDTSLTKSTSDNLSAARYALFGGSINGDKALFAGGSIDGSNSSKIADVYTIPDKYVLRVQIPPFSKYKFTESSEQSTKLNSPTLTYTKSAGGISGYIIPNGNTSISGHIS